MSLVVYLGYSNLSSQNYGSELALIKLLKQLRKWYRISILSFSSPPPPPHSEIPDIPFISPEQYNTSTFDYLIISRYINFYLYFSPRALKVFVWMHDIGLQPYFNGQPLPEGGRRLLENVVCDGLIVQTEWHQSVVEKMYPGAKTYIIGNGIDTEQFLKDRNIKKIPYSFIWTSSPRRGLSFLLNIFPMIQEKYPESQLHIYRGKEEFTSEELEFISAYDTIIHYHGALPNNELVEKFLESEVWLYPTDFNETYCISALEAQAAGCLCVCTNQAALREVVGERGILLQEKYGSEQYIEEIFKGLERVFANREVYSQREWGLKQDWSSRAERWRILLEKN